MTETLVQVGRFVLRKMSKKERSLARVSLPQPRVRRSMTLPTVCKNPHENFGRCRALTAKGTRCARGREIHSFFCPQHDPTDRLPETPPTLDQVRKFLGHFGFTGDIYKHKGEYKISFTTVRILYRGSTGITHTSFGTLAKWLHAWMKAEEIGYMGMSCHQCGKKFRLVDGKGFQCECEAIVCNDCLLKHRQSLDHLVAEPVMDAAKETQVKLEKAAKRNIELLAAKDLIKKCEKLGLPAYYTTRQKLKAVLVWTQRMMTEHITEIVEGDADEHSSDV
jgi:hypothetical protein